MKFVDEAFIDVIAGDGGNGMAGPMVTSTVAVESMNGNTLIDYRYARIHRAQKGENGRGADCYGKGGDDLVLKMPVGTVITDERRAKPWPTLRATALLSRPLPSTSAERAATSVRPPRSSTIWA